MSVSKNIDVVDAAIAEFNARDWDTFGALHADSVVLTAPGLPGPVQGREGVRQWARELGTAFPDFCWEAVHAFGQGEWVCVEALATGTHRGPLVGLDGSIIPATDRRVELPISVVFRVADSQVAEAHVYNDLLGMLVQLGVAS